MVAQIDENNSFQISIHLPYPQDFYIQYGEGDLRTLFSSPGDSLFLKIDANSSDFISAIDGTAKQTNELIIRFLKELPDDNYVFLNHNVALASKAPLDFLEYITGREKQYRSFYDKFILEHQTTGTFRKWASDILRYESYHDLLYYTWYHPFVNEIDDDYFKIPKEYFIFLENYDMDDSEIISMSHVGFLLEYARYFQQNINEKISEKIEEVYEKEGLVGMYALLIESVETETSGFTKDFLLARYFSGLLKGHALKEFDQVYDESKISNNYFLETINTEYEKLTSYLKNTNVETAAISVINSQSDIIRELTSKYVDKYIYIDFWAPWCAPCMAEMDASKKCNKIGKVVI